MSKPFSQLSAGGDIFQPAIQFQLFFLDPARPEALNKETLPITRRGRFIGALEANHNWNSSSYLRLVCFCDQNPSEELFMSNDAVNIVLNFEEKINEHDVSGLVQLFTPDGRFVDSLGNVIGMEKMHDAWTGYFRMVLDYRISH